MRPAALAIVAPLVFACLQPAEAADGYRYRIAWATYIGGSAGEQIREVIPYPDGSVLVGGQTNSPDLSVTEGVHQRTLRGRSDAFVVKLVPVP